MFNFYFFSIYFLFFFFAIFFFVGRWLFEQCSFWWHVLFDFLLTLCQRQHFYCFLFQLHIFLLSAFLEYFLFLYFNLSIYFSIYIILCFFSALCIAFSSIYFILFVFFSLNFLFPVHRSICICVLSAATVKWINKLNFIDQPNGLTALQIISYYDEELEFSFLLFIHFFSVSFFIFSFRFIPVYYDK